LVIAVCSDVRRRLKLIATAAFVIVLAATRADAHHEALFGPQSALALSGEKYFTRKSSRVGPGRLRSAFAKQRPSSVSA